MQTNTSKCKCLEDNKLTQAICPVHGGPAYRDTSKCAHPKGWACAKYGNKGNDGLTCICKCIDCYTTPPSPSSSLEVDTPPDEAKGWEKEWETFCKKGYSKWISAVGMVEGKSFIADQIKKAKEDDRRAIFGMYTRKQDRVVHAILEKEREEGRQAALDEAIREVKDVHVLGGRTGVEVKTKILDTLTSLQKTNSNQENV